MRPIQLLAQFNACFGSGGCAPRGPAPAARASRPTAVRPILGDSKTCLRTRTARRSARRRPCRRRHRHRRLRRHRKRARRMLSPRSTATPADPRGQLGRMSGMNRPARACCPATNPPATASSVRSRTRTARRRRRPRGSPRGRRRSSSGARVARSRLRTPDTPRDRGRPQAEPNVRPIVKSGPVRVARRIAPTIPASGPGTLKNASPTISVRASSTKSHASPFLVPTQLIARTPRGSFALSMARPHVPASSNAE